MSLLGSSNPKEKGISLLIAKETTTKKRVERDPRDLREKGWREEGLGQ